MLDPCSPPPNPPPVSRPRGGGAKSLFSDHYLRHRLPEHPEWGEDVAGPFEQLRALYEAKREILPNLIEAQTEAEFIRPALEILGFAYIVQTPTHHAGRVQRPDYALFADEDAKAEAYLFQDDEPAFYARALVIADAKYWERPLSETRRDDARDTFRNTNPLFQIVNYLIGTGVDWGIMTNGRLWRLHYRQASSTATEFYEVDLVEALESGDLERLKYFWLFFCRDAFIKDAQGNSFLDRVREGSATYARMVGDRLKERVFEEVFPYLSGGFVAYCAARGEDMNGEEARQAIYEATLSLLYKMLFLLYAEARDLLPIGNPGYRAQSLTQMAREVAGRMRLAEPLGRTSTAIYDRLLNLFRLIDQGDPGLGLPRYNGGLFHLDLDDPADQEKHAANWFLTRHRVSDAFLAPALDLLYRTDGEPVDYGYIRVHHLGAIYEGLLEHRLAVDDATGGRVHLETDKGERKATGSYYTPDYIVKYIVHHTVGPILEDRACRFDELMEQIAEVRRQLADSRRSASIPILRDKLERLEHQARETLLDIKVCDPAMGSGHFLVEAVDFLTDGLIKILSEHPNPNPVLTMLDRIRREIIANLERQQISIDPARLDDTQLLQRVVMKRCIYGVDLNPMAVELAKVSLWLHSFTIGAPLSFLDHHLRCGNSLIGVTAREVDQALRITEQAQRVGREARLLAEGRGEEALEVVTAYQGELWGGPFAGLLRAAEVMRGVSLLSDATFTELEESERLFRQFDEAAKPYKKLLDIFVARHFGVKRADEFLRLYGADAIQAGPETVGEPYAEVMRQARELYHEKRFFHWDLEFPEVFIDLERATWKEDPGFDAVVGNPPWLGVRTGSIDSKLLHWMRRNFVAAVGQFDLAAIFLELGSRLMFGLGQVGFVVPKRIATNESYAALRKAIAIERPLVSAVDLGVAFEGVNNDALILISGFSAGDVIILGMREGKSEIRTWQVNRTALGIMPFYIIPVNSRTPAVALLEDIAAVPAISLGKLVSIVRGAECGMNHPAIHRKSGDRGLPLVNHLDASRYAVDYSGWRIDSSKISSAKLKPTSLYRKVPKLLVRFLAAELVVGKDEIGYASTNLVYHLHLLEGLGIEINSLCALLCSRLLSFWYRTAFQNEEVKFPHVQKSHLESIPIRRIVFTTPRGERARLAGVGITEATEWIERTEEVASVSFSAFTASVFGLWLDERLSLIHTPDPALVCQHNADPLNEDWQLPEEGPAEQSDVIHDLLAHLAEQMIEMNKQKQAEIKGFLTWLERKIGASIGNLTRRTHLLNYLGDYQKGESHLMLDELLDILRQNRRQLGVNPTARDFQEQLEQEYRASLEKLLPLKARLAATDRLIDLIAYRLYRLTEEEVAVVEGAR